MKIRIESGDCPSYLTVGKVYEAFNINRYGCEIIADNGCCMTCKYNSCAHLNGGSWEIVNEEA